MQTACKDAAPPGRTIEPDVYFLGFHNSQQGEKCQLPVELHCSFGSTGLLGLIWSRLVPRKLLK